MSRQTTSDKDASASQALLPFEHSIGYQIRLTHRLVQRYLQTKIEPFGVTLGMWYFLRALWHKDGLTQRELSDVVGTMEPTTLTAIKAMENLGLVRRLRNAEDRRKINIYLTPKARDLEKQLMPLASDVVQTAVNGFDAAEVASLIGMLGRIQENMAAKTAVADLVEP